MQDIVRQENYAVAEPSGLYGECIYNVLVPKSVDIRELPFDLYLGGGVMK